MLVALALLLGMCADAFAQDPAQRIRDLYAAAAYEDVLSALPPGGEAPANPALDQFRVFSLVALGRLPEAERATEALITSAPGFHPEGDTSPRIAAMFAQVRRRVAPEALKRMYVEAREAYDRKDRDAAIAGFEAVVGVAADPELANETAVSELKLLASGFLDLSRAVPERPSASVATSPATEAHVKPPTLTPPVPIHETLPKWIPPVGPMGQMEFRGAIRVRISAAGTVASAEMETPLNPSYDALLLRVSRSWTYEPGRVNGIAVPSERLIQVVLKPK